MRREVKNKKVLQAITLGLAAVIASTSIPMDVYAAEEIPQTSDGADQTDTESSAENSSESGSESSSDAAITADEVDVVTVDTAEAMIDAAADEYEQHAEGVDNIALQADDAAIKAEVDKANDILEKSESLNNEDLKNAIVQTAVAEANIAEVQKALVGVYIENSDKDDAGKDRLQYDVPRDEDGDLVIDENDCPEVGKGSAVTQISGQYDSAGVKNRSVQGVYQEGMKEIKAAIDAREKGNDEAESEHLAKAGEWLAATESKFDDSTKALTDALVQYDAAKTAADEAQASYEKVKGLVENAIADTNAAQAQLTAAKERAEKLTAIADQYYGVMLTYFKSEVKTAEFDENGALNVEASADAASKLDNDKLKTGDGLNSTYEIGRELLEQLIMYKLESEEAKGIVFGATGVDGDGKTDNTKTGTEKKVTIEKDSKGNDKVVLSDAGSHKQFRESGDNGRMNHIKVTYTDAAGQPQTKYYNMVYKGTIYEGSDVDLNKGICYVAEVTYDNEAKKWGYTPYSEESDFLSDYTLTKGYRDAAAAVDKAAAEVKRLTDELNALSDKVATNSSVIEGLKGELDKAQKAYDNSAKSLNDFRDLYRYMTEGVQPSDLIEEDIVPEEEGEDIIPGGDVVTGDVVTGGGAFTDGATDGGAGDDAVVDAGDVVVTLPGGAGLGFNAINLNVFAGQADAGVAGVRVAGTGNAGVNIADNDTPLAGQINNDESEAPKKSETKEDKKIADPEVPLATMPIEDSTQMSWWWLLIIFLLGATGKKMYDEHKKRVEAAEAAHAQKITD
ncbi:MAG: hypothetical protein IK123_08635 [Lachnospiraceae bacterium]|nr:hypothetical protein [Lachnospiraceae bacterium]